MNLKTINKNVLIMIGNNFFSKDPLSSIQGLVFTSINQT
jgi:hypothetical protein